MQNAQSAIGAWVGVGLFLLAVSENANGRSGVFEHEGGWLWALKWGLWACRT
jgi:hypothetical protein